MYSSVFQRPQLIPVLREATVFIVGSCLWCFCCNWLMAEIRRLKQKIGGMVVFSVYLSRFVLKEL